MNKKIKIIIVDDHKVVRDGIKAALSSNDIFEISGEAENGEELFDILKYCEANIILLDVFLPKPIGIELIKIIKKHNQDVKIIILSGNYEEDLVMEAFKSGADGYLSKNIEKEELINAILSIYEGEQYISEHIEKSISKNFIKKAKYGDKYAHGKVAELTDREIEIIKLFGESLSYKEIAAQLDISVRTVESHKNNILEKLELKTVIDVVKFAIKNKIIEL